jgi:alanine racemase
VLDGIVTWAEIDLDAIAFNLRAFQKHVGERVKVIAVVKANAYGHGAAPVARAALQAGAGMLAVHRAIEGVELRNAGIGAPTLVMGYTPPSGAALVAEWQLTPSVITLEFAQALSGRAVALGCTIPVHLKVDTGMNRYGLMPGEVLDFLRAVQRLPGLVVEGMFTHFATADWADESAARGQLAVFNDVRAAVSGTGITVPLVHAANSAATMRLREAHFDAVRPGIAMYGLDPSSEWPPVFEIRPALTLKSLVARVRSLPAGAAVGYSRTYVAPKPTVAALVPVGYGDGYHRILSNKGIVLVRGQRAPVLGRVSMDQIVIDVGHIPGVQMDDEVVLVGRQGQAHLPAEEVAQLAGTINYEVTTGLLPRVARLYLQGGQAVEVQVLGREGESDG